MVYNCLWKGDEGGGGGGECRHDVRERLQVKRMNE